MSTMFDQIGATLNNDIVKPVGGFLQNAWNNSPAKAIVDSPGAKELGNEVGGFFNKPEAVQGANGVYQTPAKTTPGLIKPTTPVASHTITNTDGSTVKQTYQAPPTPKTLGDTNSTAQQEQTIQNKINADKGQLAGMGYNPDGTPIQTGTTPNPTSTMSSAAANAPTGGNATPVNNSSNNTPVYTGATTGLLNIGKGNNPILQADTQAIQNAQLPYQNLSTEQTGGVVGGSAGPESGVTGIQSQFALNALNTAQEKYANDLAEQGQQTTANQAAGNLTQPQGNTAYFGSPENGNIVGGNNNGTSTPKFPGATGNSLIDNTVYNALKMAATTGTDQANNPGLDAIKALNDPAAISAYWQGVAAINNGTYSPTVQSATAQSGATSAGQLNTDIINLNQNINQVDAAGSLVTNFMSQNPQINQTIYGMVNGQAQKYLQSIGATGAMVQYNSLMDTVKKYATNIISSGYSGTPNGAQALQQLADPSHLSLQQVQNYLATVKTDGQTQIGVKQQSLKQLGGNSPVPATTPAPIPSSPPATTSGIGANPYAQAGAATLGEGAQQIWNGLTSIVDVVGSIFMGK